MAVVVAPRRSCHAREDVVSVFPKDITPSALVEPRIHNLSTMSPARFNLRHAADKHDYRRHTQLSPAPYLIVFC